MQIIGTSSLASNVNIVNTVPTSTSTTLSSSCIGYSVKITNPSKKSEYEVLRMESNVVYASVADLKYQLLREFGGKVGDPVHTVGYIEPGHGVRGKQVWLSSANDLRLMYEMHNNKRILLWCFGVPPRIGSKRPSPNSGTGDGVNAGASTGVPRARRSTNYDRHADRISEVEEIEEELKEKHLEKFTDMQYRAWANLVKMKKHASLDQAPDLPFWRGTSKKNSCAVSPGKRVNLRGQCVDQLLKWHELLDKGAITKSEYDEFRSSIMEDARKF